MRRLNPLILVIITCCSLISCSKTVGSHATDEQQRLSRMHSQVSFDFMFNNNISVAQGEAEEALRLDPDGVEANHAMARVQQLLGNHEDVVYHYQQALRSDPYAVVVLNDYGQYLCQQGDRKKALKQFDRAGSQLMNSQRMVSYTRAAACSIASQDYDDAEKYLLRALELNPQSRPVLLNLVRVNIDKADFDKAEKYIQEYFKLEPKTSPEALKLAQQIQNNL